MTAVEPTQNAGAGGDPASAGATTEPSVPPEADFVRRAKENPEWAWEQVRTSQSVKDRAEAENQRLIQKLGRAQSLIDTYGGDTVAAAVENYRAIRNSPEIGEMIQQYEQTGQLSARKGSEPEEVEDWEKTPEERRIEALEAELKNIRKETGEISLASGRQMLEGHMKKVFAEYAFTPEDTEKMSSAMKSQFDAWERMGDPGKTALKSLMTPSGEATVRGIMLSSITPEALRAAASNIDLRKRQGLSDLATGGPSGSASTGTEPPAIFKTAKEAADFARANPDGHNSY